MERARGRPGTTSPTKAESFGISQDKEVERREGEAARAGNNAVRAWMKGQAPLDWSIDGRKPVKLRDGTRVRLDVATPTDLFNAARTLARQLKVTYDNGMIAARGLWILGAETDRRGLDVAIWLGTLAPGAAQGWDVDASELDWSDGESDEDDDVDGLFG